MKQLDLIGAVEAVVPASQLKKLAGVPGLIVTPNADVKLSGVGIDAAVAVRVGQRPDVARRHDHVRRQDAGDRRSSTRASRTGPTSAGRVIASVNLSTIAGNTSLNDERGHGTFVAGIAAGAAPDLTGAAPAAPLVSVKVMNDQGQAKTSDVITAAQWILDNKAKYNIRVANFSLHSSYSTNFYRDPLDQAVEKLWFGGVVVVAAAGNYGTVDRPLGRALRPGQRPVRDHRRRSRHRQQPRGQTTTRVAPFSAYGYTPDGFYKPDVAAPGRYMVGPIPAGSTIAAQKASNIVGSDRIQLSGTSFAAPVVAGTVAQMLARHPDWTPDQVKGALMRTARKVRTATRRRPASVRSRPAARSTASVHAEPERRPRAVRHVGRGGSGLSFDAMSWASAAKSDMSWNSMSWNSQSWSDQSWSDQSWASMSWADMSWNSMSWTDMSWADMSWADSSQEDAAEGDAVDRQPPATRSTPPTSRRLRPIRRPPSPWTGSIRLAALGVGDHGCRAGSGPGRQHGQLAPAVGLEHRLTARARSGGPSLRVLTRTGDLQGRAPEWGMRGSPPQP